MRFFVKTSCHNTQKLTYFKILILMCVLVWYTKYKDKGKRKVGNSCKILKQKTEIARCPYICTF